jgi:hypothetical protein
MQPDEWLLQTAGGADAARALAPGGKLSPVPAEPLLRATTLKECTQVRRPATDVVRASGASLHRGHESRIPIEATPVAPAMLILLSSIVTRSWSPR